MNRPTTIVLGLGMLLVALLALHLQPNAATAMQAGQPAVINNPDLIVSAVRIFRFDNQVVRLDTTTGEMSRFSGTISGGGATGTWLRFARPVTGSTSQFLQFRSIAGGAFLIDQVTGQTWVLRRAPGTIGTWVNVPQP